MEPIAACLKAAVDKTNINQKLLYRMLYYQMYYMEKSELHYIRDLEIMAENTRSLQFFMNLHLLNIDSKDAYMAASHIGRCAGLCDILRLMPYYFQMEVSMIPTELLTKHATNDSLLWGYVREGKPDEKIFDIILEYELGAKKYRIASYAKKHLELGRGFRDKVPQGANRAILLSVWCEYFLKRLEEFNFDVFDESFQKVSVFRVPKLIYDAAKKGIY